MLIYHTNNIFCKVEFSVSHDPSEIILIYWYGAHETFLIIVNIENSLIDSLMNRRLIHNNRIYLK